MLKGIVAFCPILASIAGASPALGGDKSGYHLFNPTPRDQLRELSADRPDATESPYTVDAGRLQVELSFADVSLDRSKGERTRTVSVAPVLFKVGLLHNADMQIGIDPWSRTIVKDLETGERETFQGFGDTLLRLKVNLWGNDEGDTALAIMPFVSFPTGADGLGSGKVEGGLIVPFALNLSEATSLGLMAELDAVRSENNERYVLDFVHTATIATTIAGPVGGFVEYLGIANLNGDSRYRASLITGLTWALSPDLVLDGGVRIGLTRAAEDFGAFAGLTVRF